MSMQGQDSIISVCAFQHVRRRIPDPWLWIRACQALAPFLDAGSRLQERLADSSTVLVRGDSRRSTDVATYSNHRPVPAPESSK